jgi:tetratricopeptide (TPR) repeat protein
MGALKKNSLDESLAREQARLAGLILALLTLLVYLPVCFHDFIFFDDPEYVTDNPVVQAGLTGAGLKWAFVGWHAANWHPLTWLSHMLDCQLVGLNPGAQHFINVLFHAANVVLVFHLWRRLTGTLWPAALVAALFAWHPLHVESVAWIAERKDVLSTLFGLLATVSYVNYALARTGKGRQTAGRGSYGLAVLWFVLALLSKPMLVTLPFVFLLLDFWPLGRFRDFQGGWKPAARLLWEKAPFIVLAAVFCVITLLAQGQGGQAVMSLDQRPAGLRLENALVAYGSYVLKTFWPTGLGVIYPLPPFYSTVSVALAGILLAGVSAVAVVQRRQRPWLLMGWLWFLGTLVPVIGLVQAGNQAMADRYTYWPSIGLFVALVFTGAEVVRRDPTLLRPVNIFAGVWVCLCIAVTERQLSFWSDSESLFAHTLAVTKQNGQAEMLLGTAFERAGAMPNALDCYSRALGWDKSLVIRMPGGARRPLAVQAALLGAQAAEEQGDAINATALYRQALGLDPTLVEAHNDLGNLLDEAGAEPEAVAQYGAAINLAPAEPLAHENLGSLLLKLGRFDEAMQQYQQAESLQPNDPRVFFLIGKACLRHGQSTEAAAQFRHALELDTNDLQSLTFLARILASDANPRNRDGAAAVALAEKANTLASGAQPYILDVLAMTYAEAGRFADAQATATKALELAKAASLSNMAASIQVHLQSFQAGRPCRETFTNSFSTK